MSATKTRLGVSAWAICVFVVTLGSNGVRSLIGFPGYLAVIAVLTGVSAWMFFRYRPPRFRWYRMPKMLIAFLLLAALSISWSAYRFESLLGTIAQVVTTFLAMTLAVVLTWQEVLRTLGTALRWLLGLSLAFELFVSVVIREPLLQGFVEVNDPENPSRLLYWSRNLLFEGGPIQGVVANSAMFGFLSLLALIVFAVQLRGGLVRPFPGWAWLATAFGCILLTRAATVWIALAVVGVSLAFALWARRAGEHRAPVYAVGLLGLASAAAMWIFARSWVLQVLGKSDTLTGRSEIWEKVIALASERPWFGWGWISYWAPWVEPFKSLDKKAGLPVMHAHNAWLDVWFQLGYVGLAIFVLLALITVQRVWCRAVDAPRRGSGPPLPFATSTLFPWLVTCALIVQSFSESRILIEGGWILFVLFAIKTRTDYELPSQADEPTLAPWKHVPIQRPQADRRVRTTVAPRAGATSGASHITRE